MVDDLVFSISNLESAPCFEYVGENDFENKFKEANVEFSWQ